MEEKPAVEENKKKASRNKSNVSNYVLLLIGVLISVGDLIFVCVNASKSLEWWKSNLMEISPFVIFWGFVISIASIYLIKSVQKLNAQLNQEMFPYNFDYVKEVAIYTAVGSSKKEIKCDGTDIEIYENYTKWKEHIISEYRKKDCIIQLDYENFYRFLIKQKRTADSSKQMIYEILIPVEVGVIAVCCGTNGFFANPIANAIGVVVGSCFFMWKAMKKQFENEDEKNFIEDFLEIMQQGGGENT